jgi:hypothetical protein
MQLTSECRALRARAKLGPGIMERHETYTVIGRRGEGNGRIGLISRRSRRFGMPCKK